MVINDRLPGFWLVAFSVEGPRRRRSLWSAPWSARCPWSIICTPALVARPALNSSSLWTKRRTSSPAGKKKKIYPQNFINLDKNYPGPCHCQVCWYPWISFSHSNVTREMISLYIYMTCIQFIYSIRGWLELKDHWFSIVIISWCNGALFFVESSTYHADLIFWHRCTCIMILVLLELQS